MCDLRIFGLFVAFSVFMALKVKQKTLAEFSKPFDHIMAKKYIKNNFFAIWSLTWPSKFFFGFFLFFSYISGLRFLLGCYTPISKLIIIPKGKWFKFLISNHSVLEVAVLEVAVLEDSCFKG